MTIVMTGCDSHLSQQMIHQLIQTGHVVCAHFESSQQANTLRGVIGEEAWASNIYPLISEAPSTTAITTWIRELRDRYGHIDAVIHGPQGTDEPGAWEEGNGLGKTIARDFTTLFRFSRSLVNQMIKQKRGSIIYVLMYDPLYHAGFPTTPIRDHGKLAMMKCIAREASAFNISCNAITFGYYDCATGETEVPLREQLKIYGLKPQLRPFKELTGSLEILLDASRYHISGHNLCITQGIEVTT